MLTVMLNDITTLPPRLRKRPTLRPYSAPIPKRSSPQAKERQAIDRVRAHAKRRAPEVYPMLERQGKQTATMLAYVR